MSGELIDKNGKTHTQDLLFFCRDLDTPLVSDMTRLENDLRTENLIDFWKIDTLDFQIEAVRMKDVYELIKVQMKKNPLYLCSLPEEREQNWRKRQTQSRFI